MKDQYIPQYKNRKEYYQKTSGAQIGFLQTGAMYHHPAGCIADHFDLQGICFFQKPEIHIRLGKAAVQHAGVGKQPVKS